MLILSLHRLTRKVRVIQERSLLLLTKLKPGHRMRQTHTLVKIPRSIAVAEKTEWLTVEQIAQELGVHPETIRAYIRDGFLKAVQLKRSYRLRRSDYEDFLKRRETGQR